MSNAKGKLAFDLAQGRISVDAFVAQFGADPRASPDVIRTELERSMAEKAPGDVEHALILASHFGLSPSYAGILCALLGEDWHFKHEDIAGALQDLREPSAVGSLYEAALRKFGYLAYDDSTALARKCTWALHDIGTPEAIAKLRLLSECQSEVIRGYAAERLASLAARRPEDPAPSYRLARNRALRSDGR